jgi:hypothetical protein
LAAAVFLAGVDRLIAALPAPSVNWPALRVRVVAVSLVVVAVASRWVVQRNPW